MHPKHFALCLITYSTFSNRPHHSEKKHTKKIVVCVEPRREEGKDRSISNFLSCAYLLIQHFLIDPTTLKILHQKKIVLVC